MVQTIIGTDQKWYRPLLVQSIIGTDQKWYRPLLVQSIIGTDHYWYSPLLVQTINGHIQLSDFFRFVQEESSGVQKWSYNLVIFNTKKVLYS